MQKKEKHRINLYSLIISQLQQSRTRTWLQMWLTAEKGGINVRQINSLQPWFQPLICLMRYDILPRWLLVTFIHINEHHQLADSDDIPSSLPALRQRNVVAIINHRHLSIWTCRNQPHQNNAHSKMWYHSESHGAVGSWDSQWAPMIWLTTLLSVCDGYSKGILHVAC